MLFSVYCHCKACTRWFGQDPVHLFGVAGADNTQITVKKGEECIKRVADEDGPDRGIGGKMEHFFCTEVGMTTPR